MSQEFYYIGHDLWGYRYNNEFPPNTTLHGNDYYGYKNAASQVLFYDFAVQMYDVRFKYHGNMYFLMYTPEHAALCDEKFTNEIEIFATPNDLIKNLEIEGRKLLEIIDEIEEIEPV